MTTQPSFSASDSLTGYLFQVKYALLDTLRRLKEEVEFTVSIETLDDVVFETSGQPLELLQLKHHSKPANLTDASVDLWKTIRIWVEQYKAGKLSLGSMFYLVTTAKVSENSAIFHLRPDHAIRDIPKTISRLDSVAQSSTNQENASAYSVYRLLSEKEKQDIFSSVLIIDTVPTIIDLDNEIRKEIFLVVDKKFINSFSERLESWWYRRALLHLTQGDRKPILSEEIIAEFGQLREQFKQDNLPVDDDIWQSAIDDAIYQDRVFVHQLKIIDVGTKRIFLAARDYFRAFEQRSRWIREDLLEVGEIDRYEQLLMEEWEIHFEQMRDLLSEDVVETEKIRLAQELYAWIESGALKQIRPQVSQPSLARGSYQILSDSQAVGWHPNFKERLVELLGV